MHSRDYSDILAGAALFICGAAFSLYSVRHYDLGTLGHMGSGMFPMALGALLAIFGILLIIPALFRRAAVPEIRFWTPLFVLLGVGAFALVLRPFGLMPAIVAVIVVSSFAELKVRPLSMFLLCVILCVLAYLVFRVGLGMQVDMIRWPF